MKIFKLLAFLLLFGTVSAQKQVTFQAYQDAGLLVFGDDERNLEPGTLNGLLRFSLQGGQGSFGYFTVSPEFEYAQLDGIYKRYSVNVGYTFNRLIIPKSELDFSIGWGWIEHYGLTDFSGAASITYKFLLNDNLKFTAMVQLVDRTDIIKAKYSGFIGFEFSLFKVKKIRK